MKTEEQYHFPKTGIHRYVAKYIRAQNDLTGKVVLDIPCGDGRSSYEFLKKGAVIKAFDLFPHFMKLTETEAEYADLTETLPVEDNSVDYIICQEGIEHVPNQLRVLEEFNRVLRKDGVLIITTPNYSHFRARLSRFFGESDYWQRMAPTEVDSIWFSENESNKLYFGHLFLLGVQHFQSLLAFSGFKTRQRLKTDIGTTSLVLGLVFYPLMAIFSIVSFGFYRKKNAHLDPVTKDRILWKRVKLNLSPKTLFCKHIFWVLSKENELHEMLARLKKMHRISKHV